MSNSPGVRPVVPHFSSGPCAKRPGWNLQALTDAVLGRSHRSKIGKSKLKRAIDLTAEILGVPKGYRVGIVPASDTGAVEMALWSLLGPRPVTMIAWESFGEGWVTDVVKQLKLKDVRVLKAPYGQLPDLKSVDFSRDVLFTWNRDGLIVLCGVWPLRRCSPSPPPLRAFGHARSHELRRSRTSRRRCSSSLSVISAAPATVCGRSCGMSASMCSAKSAART